MRCKINKMIGNLKKKNSMILKNFNGSLFYSIFYVFNIENAKILYGKYIL